MPGIVGIVGQGPRGKYERDLKLMLDCMLHEPFYRQGSYINEDLGLYAGWTCHPGSFTDCMPVVNENQDIVLIFSGEDFSHRAHSEQIKANVLLQGYEQKGVQFLRDLNGWFSGVIIDLRKSMVFLFNDRYGMNRIYYHEGKEEFLFGSEAKSLLKVRPELRSLDPKGLGELVSCNCVLQNRTLFTGVALLPGGSIWSWAPQRVTTKGAYFNASEWEDLPALDSVTFANRLKETVLRTIPRYFQEKGQVGLSLTGGLDSRMIMACLNPEPGDVPCYTFGGEKDVLDISIARQIAELYGQKYEVLRFGGRFFSEFPRLAEKTIRVSDGSLDIGCVHDMYFNELAREIAPIRVTGKFGSEVIRDHTMFNAWGYEGELFCDDFKQHVSNAVTALKAAKDGHRLSVAVFKDFPWREYNKIALEQSQSVFRSPYLDNELVGLMYQAPPGLRASNEAQRRIIRECNAKLSALITDRGYSEQANPVVAKVLEFYYYALFKLDYTYFFALPHWLTRIDTMCASFAGGPRIFGSQKFEYYRIWFRDELCHYVKEVLLDPRTAARPWFNRKALEMMVHSHTKGTRNYLNEINKAMSIELLHRVLIDA